MSTRAKRAISKRKKKNVKPLNEQNLIKICRANDVTLLGIFGSAARGEATAQSDIDLLVRFAKEKSLLKVAALALQLENAVGKKVDLLTESAISPYIRERVQREMKVIYELK
jgi:predicted nucleotidyltransferase